MSFKIFLTYNQSLKYIIYVVNRLIAYALAHVEYRLRLLESKDEMYGDVEKQIYIYYVSSLAVIIIVYTIIILLNVIIIYGISLLFNFLLFNCNFLMCVMYAAFNVGIIFSFHARVGVCLITTN